ncbi:hypothetical protein MPTK1_7g15770 [Marchantia polymorpha subsp. ruderalis]|uniref:Uncharacterized protein n=2 Tax=Marchantia polymorpha TaxID=3197 RepID=A0AAF6C032_MARPO|nr:hypothetical protein MARPO_0111s0042 [Marchantia polymorpha]BBN17616.1 hypothetical protein Mp_7g15770 [Marchantia polymorpha subsp. ruderalis]|eukprot:PTQ31486.1 hypothetical protein MARPO_0111s0042 [Marchantia polymorpha]
MDLAGRAILLRGTSVLGTPRVPSPAPQDPGGDPSIFHSRPAYIQTLLCPSVIPDRLDNSTADQSKRRAHFFAASDPNLVKIPSNRPVPNPLLLRVNPPFFQSPNIIFPQHNSLFAFPFFSFIFFGPTAPGRQVLYSRGYSYFNAHIVA